MRILIATTFRYLVGGVETYLKALLPALVQRRHEVALLHEYADVPGQARIDDDVPGLPAWCVRSAAWARTSEEVAGWCPDVVYLQGLAAPDVEEALQTRFATVLFAHNYHGACVSGTKRHAAPWVQPCARTLGAGCLLHYYPRRCGGLNPKTMWKQYRLQRRRQRLLPGYRAVVVGSRHMHDEYRREGVLEDHLHVAPLFPPGVTPDPHPPGDRPLSGRVLMVSRLTDLKGGRFLVEAAARASARLRWPLTLVVGGDGPEKHTLEARSARLGVRAEFVGWLNEKQRTALMRESDLLAVPSVWPEPFGLVGLEAGCIGLPAAAFAVGGVPDWLTPGESGELAPGNPPTVAGLADALVRALADPSHLRQLRLGAWHMAHRFTRERHLTQLEAILEKAARG